MRPALAAPLCASLALALASCAGPSASARRAEQLVASGRADEAVAVYQGHVGDRGTDDPDALSAMARTTLALGLKAGAVRIQIAAIQAIERREIEALAIDVAMLVGVEDDTLSAAASVALLRAHPDAPFVCTELLASEVAEARALCAEGIGRKVGLMARAELLPLLSDREARVRRAAVAAIGRMDQAEDTSRMVEIAGRDPDDGVRAAALRALTGRNGPLIVALAHRALGLAPDGAPAPPAAALVADAYLGARLAAIELLAALGAPVEAALDRLSESDDLSLAIAAAAARYRRTDVSGRPVLERALASAAWTVRAAALNAAMQAAPRHQLLELAGRAIADPRTEVRLAAARLLARLGQPARAAIEFRAALADRSPDVRLDAASELGKTGDADGLEALSRLARHRDAGIRGAAIAAHLTARRVTSGLVAALADRDPLLRIAAAELLIELTD